MPKREAPDIPNAALISREQLSAEFADLVSAVDEEIQSESLRAELPPEIVEDVAAALGDFDRDGQRAIEKRDRLAELILAIEAHEQRLRDHVKRAENAARHAHSLASGIRWSLLTYMQMRGIKSIPGEISRFAVASNPDRLVISDESAIPDEFFDEETKVVRTLNREALELALRSGRDIPGAYVESNRKRLQIR